MECLRSFLQEKEGNKLIGWPPCDGHTIIFVDFHELNVHDLLEISHIYKLIMNSILIS